MSCSCVLGIQRIRPLNLLLSSTKFKTYVTTVGQKFPKTSVEMNNFRKTLKIFNSSFSTRQLETAFSRRLNMMSRTMPSKGVQMGPSHDKANRILFRMLSGNNQYRKKLSEKHKSVAMYALSLAILIGGGSYAAVPLYRLYCQASGYGGTVRVADIGEKIETMEKQKHRVIKVKFNADKGATMRWSFRPQQAEIKIVPGETALAFYTAKNPTDVPITGISTYNVIPFEAGQYFNKIQCFCFEEQRLNPGEEPPPWIDQRTRLVPDNPLISFVEAPQGRNQETPLPVAANLSSRYKVDMPVFFYIDPEFVDDPYLTKVNEITLSYTFFEAKDISWPDLQKYANK